MLTIDFEGIPAITHALQRLVTQAQAALVAALQEEAQDILDASYQLVPVDTTALVQSGEVEAQAEGATIRYGGHGAVPYAIVQHEDTTLQHPRGGQSHYLSQPLFEATATMPARLAAAMAPRLRR